MAKVINNKEKISIWKQWESAVAYKRSINLEEKIIRQVKFYEGDQWGEVSEKTKYLPRPVFNIIKMICRNKKSGILSNKVKLLFKNYKDTEKGRKLTRFIEHLQKELKQNDLDDRAINDGGVKGTYVYHYYYDAEAKGVASNYTGGVRGEVVDCLNVGFANPSETDEQKQAWIIIASRVEVDTAKEMADNKIKAMLVSKDNENTNYNTEKEQEGTEMCTVLTKYFRINGEVYLEKAVKGGTICEARPLAPELIHLNEIKPDGGDSETPDIAVKSDAKRVVANTYPIAVGNYELREKCIYGIGEVETIIPNQIAINFQYAMQLLATQNCSWPKNIVKAQALRGQRITNEPGQTLVDFSPDGNGIKQMPPAQISSAPTVLADNIVQLTKTATGATDVITGEGGSNLSGVAIAQLQSQALKPIEGLRQNFWRVKEKIGKILAQFCKTHYCDNNYEFIYEDKDNEMQIDSFNGEEIENDEFDVVVEAGAASQFSEFLTMSNLSDLFKAGVIDANEYVKLYPDNAMPNKQEILEYIENKQASETMQLAQQVAQLQEQNKELQVVRENYPKMIEQMNTLCDKFVLLQKEYAQKVEYLNQAAIANYNKAENIAATALSREQARLGQAQNTGAIPNDFGATQPGGEVAPV